MFKLKATLAAVVLATSGAAQAITIDETDMIVSIVRDGLTGDSMLVNTNVQTWDVFNRVTTSWQSDAAMTAAIGNFIAGATDVRFWAIGALSSSALTGGTVITLTGEPLIDTAAANGTPTNFNSFVLGANNVWFNDAPTDYVAGIPSGDRAHFVNNQLSTNLLTPVSMGEDLPVFESSFGFFTGFQTSDTGLDWNLDPNGQLSLGSAVSAVPVPAAVWLFGSGLLGLVGVARRRQVQGA